MQVQQYVPLQKSLQFSSPENEHFVNITMNITYEGHKKTRDLTKSHTAVCKKATMTFY